MGDNDSAQSTQMDVTTFVAYFPTNPVNGQLAVTQADINSAALGGGELVAIDISVHNGNGQTNNFK